MIVAEHPESPVTRHRLVQLGAIWFLAAIVAGPLGIVLHEAAHFLTAVAFGFDGAVLHFASSGYASNDAFWQAYLGESPEVALSPCSAGSTSRRS